MSTRTTALLGLFLVAAAGCGSSPTTPTNPDAPPPAASQLTLAQGQTATPRGTTLRLTFEDVSLPHLTQWDCFSGPCNFGPAAWVLMAVPGQAEQRSPVFIPEPNGTDRQRYGGYTVRLIGFEPRWNAAAPQPPGTYRAVFEVTAD
jgi:hypothetical protein